MHSCAIVRNIVPGVDHSSKFHNQQPAAPSNLFNRAIDFDCSFQAPCLETSPAELKEIYFSELVHDYFLPTIIIINIFFLTYECFSTFWDSREPRNSLL